ncbi:hypothetical protein F511_40411 [Dorcoceras hygrometricum]|uniref:Uncharacterized protein n=1 Tax=Dorcoceras hygrometricum TaxID=472368 RepID=A0A2Z7B215_9LAMI|nr:hypothetical protein F511_40411 [Dorcoceras hygrometricum]
MCVSIWELPTRLSTRYQVHYQRSTCCCPTYEMWELPTPLTVANSPSREMRDGSYPRASTSTLARSISKQDTATRDLITAWNRCVYAVQQNATDNKTIYTSSQNSKHEHISMPISTLVRATQISHLLSQSKTTTQGPKHRKATTGSYNSTNAILPSISTEISNQTQSRENVQKQYPNEASQQEESNATTLTSIGAVYRSAIEEDKVR